jgi:hypothetical protein
MQCVRNKFQKSLKKNQTRKDDAEWLFKYAFNNIKMSFPDEFSSKPNVFQIENSFWIKGRYIFQ